MLTLKIFGRSTECVGLKILGALFLGTKSMRAPAEDRVSCIHYRILHPSKFLGSFLGAE